MKKYILGMIMAVFAFIAVLPMQVSAADAEDKVTITDAGDGTAVVKLTLPDAAKEKISTIRMSLKVEPEDSASSTVSFEFAEEVKGKAKVSEFRYHADTKELNVYISGTNPLFEDGKDTIELGTVKTETAFKVNVIEDSLKAVTGSRESGIALADYPVVAVSGAGGGAGDPGTGGTAQKLTDTLKDAESLLKDNYTAESYAALQKAIEAAKKVLGDPGATDADREQALKELQNAMGALVPKDTNSAQQKHDQDVKDQKIQPAKTGDTNPIWLYVGILVVCVVVIAVIIYLKKKDKK